MNSAVALAAMTTKPSNRPRSRVCGATAASSASATSTPLRASSTGRSGCAWSGPEQPQSISLRPRQMLKPMAAAYSASSAAASSAASSRLAGTSRARAMPSSASGSTRATGLTSALGSNW
ncbi:hypothetical protein D9M71_743270 [compost metagenome]